MAWLTGTATDYRDMLDDVITIITADHVDTVAIVSGGTGYAVDELITLTDGTFSSAAIFRVTSVSSGVIDGIRMEEHGAYTVDPDLTATTSHTSSGSGTGATFNLTMNSEPWTVERRAQEAVSATIASGGSGYSVSDQITLTMDGGGVLGSDDNGVLPVFNVDSVSSGAVTAVSLVTSGHLEEVPDTDTGTGGSQANVTGGGGTGCVLTVTYQDVAASKEDVVVVSGPGEGGTDQILVGFRTFQATDQSGFLTCYNWQLVGMVEFNSGLALHAQGNISYGMDPTTGDIETDGGSFMVLKENDSDPDISYWISVTNRRIILICKVETNTTAFYSSMYTGFLNQFATEDEEPYPLWIQGCTSRENSYWGDTVIGRISGLSDMYAISTKLKGPAQYRAVSGVWENFKNYSCSDGGSPTRTADQDFIMYPTCVPTLDPQDDDKITDTATNGVYMADVYPSTGVPGTPNYLLRPTPNTGDDVRVLVPLSPMMTENAISPPADYYSPLGELDNCYWVSASDASTNLTSEDVQKIGDDRYRVFQNGNQSSTFSYFCVKEE